MSKILLFFFMMVQRHRNKPTLVDPQHDQAGAEHQQQSVWPG